MQVLSTCLARTFLETMERTSRPRMQWACMHATEVTLEQDTSDRRRLNEPTKTIRNEWQPRWKGREHREVIGHVACAEWCQVCVSGRDRSGHHRHRQSQRSETVVPMISVDSCFPEGSSEGARSFDGEHESTMKTRAGHDRPLFGSQGRTQREGERHWRRRICKVLVE